MRILISGFCPFGLNKINSSWEVAKATSLEEFSDVELDIVQLPVSFTQVKSSINDLIASYCPDVWIMLGQASKSNEVRLERIAVNLMDSSKPDNDGLIPDEESIVEDGISAYFCTSPLKKIKSILEQKDVPIRISNSAGTFVCNAAYYYALYRNQMQGNKMKVLFVHLPSIKENNSQPTVSLSLELMKRAVFEIIQFMAEHNLK